MLQTNKCDLNAISGVQDISDVAAEKYSGGNVSDARAAFLAQRAANQARIDALRAGQVSGTNVSTTDAVVTNGPEGLSLDVESSGNTPEVSVTRGTATDFRARLAELRNDPNIVFISR